MIDDHIKEIFSKYYENRIEVNEARELYQWLLTENNKAKVEDILLEQFDKELLSDDFVALDFDRNQMLQNIFLTKKEEAPKQRNIVQKRFWLKFTAAASILFGLLFLGYHYRLIYEQDKPLPFVLKAQDDIPAGGKKALLILSNGKRLVLDSIGQNRLFDENGIRISRLDDGQLRYTVDADISHNPKIFNTIQTPTGGNYQIVLHDGTKVWLNAMSTLKFPTAFSPTERTVELTGEAYFEVAHDKSKPFTVNVNNVVVKVLGTHFNINSYTKSTKVATTVLEGAVAVSGGSVALPKTVLPGSTLSYNILNETMYLQKNVDIEEIVAWKDGYFNASSISLKQLMEEVSRWYGVAIIYQTNNRETEFVGKLPKNISLKDLLTLLELAGELKFNLTSKTVTIMDK